MTEIRVHQGSFTSKQQLELELNSKLKSQKQAIKFEFDNLKLKYNKLLHDIELLHKECDELKKDNGNLQDQIESLNNQIFKMKLEKEKVKNELKELQSKLVLQSKEIKDLANKVDVQTGKIGLQSKDIKDLTSKVKTQTKDIRDLKDQVQQLSEKLSAEKAIREAEKILADKRLSEVSVHMNGYQHSFQLVEKQKGFLLEDKKDFSVNGQQVLLRKIANSFAERIISKVFGSWPANGIYNLHQLAKYMDTGFATPEEKGLWKTMQKDFKINDTFVRTLNYLKDSGNLIAHEIKPNDIEQAKKAISSYPAPLQVNILAIINAMEKLSAWEKQGSWSSAENNYAIQ